VTESEHYAVVDRVVSQPQGSHGDPWRLSDFQDVQLHIGEAPKPPPPEDNTLRDLIPAYEEAREALAKARTLDEVRSIP
jgi:hypothetical protein